MQSTLSRPTVKRTLKLYYLKIIITTLKYKKKLKDNNQPILILISSPKKALGNTKITINFAIKKVTQTNYTTFITKNFQYKLFVTLSIGCKIYHQKFEIISLKVVIILIQTDISL